MVDDPALAPMASIGQSVHLQLAQANRAMEDRRYDAAADAFRKVVELDPDNFSARRGLAVSLFELGDAAAAIEHLEEALRRIQGDDETVRARRIEILRTVSAFHLRAGDDDLAIGALERLLAIDPERLEARAELADALARRGRLDDAIAEYDRILAVEPKSAATLVKRATARINQGEVEAGIRDFELAVAAAPGEPAIRLRYAEALDRLRRADAAAAQRTAAVRASQSGNASDRAHFLAEEGRRAMAAGRYAEAAESLRQAVEVAPDDLATRLELARVLGHLGRFDQAEAEFARVIAASPRHEEAWRGRALTLLLAGKLDSAKETLRDALQTFPRSSPMANALARLLATAQAAGVRNGPLALDLAQRVHQVHADSSTAETLAAALAENGRFTEAVELQRPVAASAGEGPVSELSRARLAAYERGEPWRLRTPEEIAVLISTPKG